MCRSRQAISVDRQASYIGIQVKTATGRIGDKQNGDTLKRRQPERRQLRSYRRQIVKMVKFASWNADTFGQIGDNFGRTLTLTLTPNP